MNKTDIIDKLLKLAILLMRSSSEPYTKPFLELLEEKFREVDLPATTLPVLRYAPLLLKQSTLETLPFVKEFVSEIGNLNWRQTYDRCDRPGLDFLNNYGFSALVSPAGPFASEKVRLGVLFLGPHTLYPEHAHAAEELYLILSGCAAWSQAGQQPRSEEPGKMIFHRSNVWHSVQTFEEPLLALYAWRGANNSVPKSYFR